MSNVVNLESKRKEKQEAQDRDAFLSYLKSLSLRELQIEAQYILNKISHFEQSEQYILKAQYLLEELSQRSDLKELSDIISRYIVAIKEKVRKLSMTH